MKRKMILIAVLLSLSTVIGYAQFASATWALTADTSVAILGNVTAPVQVFSKTAVVSDTLSVRDYAGGTTTLGSPVGVAERIWCHGAYWPKESVMQTGRYIQFSISPLPNNKLTVTSITFNIGGFGGANVLASYFYSTDSTFATRTKIDSAVILPDARTAAMTSISVSPSVLVDTGKTFYLRVYPYYNSTSSPTKYILMTNVVISGTTALVGNPSLAEGPAALSFGTTNQNRTKDLFFTLSGTLLNPASDSIRITPPADFLVSSKLGSGYSSYLALPYSGSTFSLDTVFVRFAPSMVKTYSDSVLLTGGSTSQEVYVNGTAVDVSTILGIFVSTTGSDADSGTYTHPYLTIQKAISIAQAGDSIFVRAGTYTSSTAISLSSSGTEINRIALYAYPPDGVRPIIDFSSEAYGTKGISLSGSYWHMKGLDVCHAGDNGIYTTGSNNIIEYCAFHENCDGGCQLGGGASYNRIINCDSYFNYDSLTSTGAGGNADGFSPKIDVGTGNYFYGCRSWQNSDDGWDGFLKSDVSIITTVDSCWAWKNGYLKDGTTHYSSMNGNGFKTGGSSGHIYKHDMVLKNCLSFDNYSKGFDQNGNIGSISFLNCTSYNNGQGDSKPNYYISEALASGKVLTVENCIALGPTGVSFSIAGVFATNSWSSPFSGAAVSDFVSLDTTGISGPRKADGSLPDITFMHLTTTSLFVNGGTNIGLSYYGTLPDLGCFETSVLSGVADGGSNDVPSAFALSQNYPNPFNPSTVISYQLASSSHVTLKIYDVLGREAATLVDGVQQAGTRTAVWNAARFASGVYFYKLTAGTFTSVKKLILMK
jgi:hypothetical protein